MSGVSEPLAADRTSIRLGDCAVLAALVLGATAFTCLMNAAQIGATLHGHFGDPDDAMRLVEVRAWLGGQSWFDMNASRLDPPHGSFMHWSRLVDLPAAALIRLFGRLMDPVKAERWAAVAVPTLWLALLYVAMARLATLLMGREARVPALLGTMFSGASLVQFAPGRIGHHAPETVALLFAVTSAVAALDPRHARQAAIAGGLVALSLAMSLETLPFLVVLIGVIVLLWVRDGDDLANTLAWWACGLLLGLPVVFVMTMGPDRWFAPVCDAYGAAHLGAGMVGAAGLLALRLATPYLRTWRHRLAAAAAVAAVVLLFVAVAYPACLHSPFAGVDRLVRDIWLFHVVESLSLPAFLKSYPMVGLAILCPAVLGAVGSAAAALTSGGIAGRRFSVLAVLSGFGLGLALWQVRVLGSATPLALLGGVYLVTLIRRRLASAGLTLAAAFAPIFVLAFTSTGWALALPSDAPSTSGADSCLAPEALAPLKTLPAGSAIAPIDSGSHLLEATDLSVFAAPYHRNDDGNRFAFDVFLAAPDEARALLATRNVTYVVTCPGMAQMTRLAARAPDGLAARLADGRIPDFLIERRLQGTPYKVYTTQSPVR